jgi:hypothetical protein
MAFIPTLPCNYELPESSQVALIVIDMQQDFLEPGGFGDILGTDILPTLKSRRFLSLTT